MRLLVVGAAGRMGRWLVRVVAETDGLELAGALERPGAGELGTDAGVLAGLAPLGVPVTDDPEPLFAAADGVLDFTAPASTRAFADRAAAAGLVHVVGTTGLSAEDDAHLARAAGRARIVRSGNMSLGVNLLAALVRRAAAALGEEFDVEVVEMHHRMKVDAPSGTALMLGEAAATGRGVDLREAKVAARDGHTGARSVGAIGFASLRGGTVIGDHAVVFAGPGERIELGHRAEDRGLFARGAIRAALWARDRAPGLYGMDDVLGLSASHS